MSKKLAQLLSGVAVSESSADPSLEILSLAYDSRKTGPGSLFFAIPGFKQDGHDFVARAAGAGATVAVVERLVGGSDIPQVRVGSVRKAMAQIAAAFYGNPGDKLTLIGVTGTNGKTTTTFLIESILKESGLKTGLLGGIKYRLGSRTLPALRTTPESVDIQEMLDEMVQSGLKAAVLEVSSHGIELHRTDCLGFDIAVFTNLTQDHLDLHGDIESYYQVKRGLFFQKTEGKAGAGEKSDSATCRALAKSKRLLAVINVDDDYGRRLAREITGQKGRSIITYAVECEADVNAIGAEFSGGGTVFELLTPSGGSSVNLNLPGRHNLENALAAAGAALALKVPLEVICRGLEKVKCVPGRFEIIKSGIPFSVIIDYAHNEDGLTKTLSAARTISRGRLILVFGCPGERDREKRPLMGKVAGTLSDLAILTTDDCYGESPEQIMDEAEAGLEKSGADYQRIPDRRLAIGAALTAAEPGDTVLIAGKGHETRQIMAEGPVAFNDRQVVMEILAQNKQG